MKLFDKIKKCTFMLALLISTLLLTLLGYMGKSNVYAGYSTNLGKAPQLTVVLEGIKDGTYPWKMLGQKKAVTTGGDNAVNEASEEDAVNGQTADNTDSTGTAAGSGESKDGKPGDTSADGDSTKGNASGHGDKDNSAKGSKDSNAKDDAAADQGTADKNTTEHNTAGKDDAENNASDKDNPDKSGTDKGSSDKKNTGDSGDKEPGKGTDAASEENSSGDQGGEENGDTGKDSPDSYEFVTVEESYFDDALFIGDSRTVGLSEYSGWTRPTYCADVGLTIYDVFDKKIADVGGKKLTLDKALEQRKFGKIYIMLGINELGRGTTKSFAEEYKKVLDQIQKLQPGAIIFIESIMDVSKKKSDQDPIFNNKNIKDRNDEISLLADNQSIFYIDVNEAVTDQSGGIPEKYTFDSVHLKAAYYKLWTDFLLKHGISGA